LKNLFAIHVLPILPIAVLAFGVCQFGLLSTGYINTSHASDTPAVSIQTMDYNSASEEQKVLREEAQKAKSEKAKEESSVPASGTPPVESTQAPPAEQVASVPVITEEATPPPVVVPEPVAPVYVEPAPVAAPEPVAPAYVERAPVVQAPVVSGRQIYVGLSGGQSTIDLCQGPVLFQGSGLPYPYIAEHENCGGWWRIGSLQVGNQVNLSGLVAGTYTVGQVLSVNKFDTTDVLVFSSQPRAILQTCIPGTNQMLVFGLY
jgi:hypothetical protein